MINKQLIILEGPDGGGKSTLAAQLKEDFDAEIYHFGPLLELNGDELCTYLIKSMRLVLSNQRNVIFDRSWLSEQMYGPSIRYNDRLVECNNYQILNTIARICNAKVIFCLPFYETAKQNFINSKEEYLENIDQWNLIDTHYRSLSQNYDHLPSMSFDYQVTEYLDLINFIKRS
jgi:thymidylate kinase